MCIKNIEKFFDVEKNIFNIVEGIHIPGLTNPSINNEAQFSTELFYFIKPLDYLPSLKF